MAYDFSSFEDELNNTVEWFKEELSAIRTGEANPAILDSVTVDSYGSDVPLNQVGNIGREDSRTLRVEVWNNEDVPKVEKAIIDADLGVSVSSSEGKVRVSFPQLTKESREKFLKMAKEKLEEARVAVRRERDDVWNDIKSQEKEGDITEDEMYRYKEKMEDIVDEANQTLKSIYENKEDELTS